jgi:hypothetical protein
MTGEGGTVKPGKACILPGSYHIFPRVAVLHFVVLWATGALIAVIIAVYRPNWVA